MREQLPQAAPNKVYVLMRLPNVGILQAACHAADIPSAKGGYVYGCRLFVFDGVTEATIEYVNTGTLASCTFTAHDLNLTEEALLSGLTATAAELNTLHTQTLATGAAAGFTGGTGTVYKNSVQLSGGIYYTTILFDLTGLGSSTTDLDIIGQGVSAAHMGQLTAAQNGTILGGTLTCLEVPVTGVTDIDLYWATEATGKFDDAVTGLTETVLLTNGGAWTLALTKALADPVGIANGYLYLCNGAAGTVGTYTAGKFRLDLFGV